MTIPQLPPGLVTLLRSFAGPLEPFKVILVLLFALAVLGFLAITFAPERWFRRRDRARRLRSSEQLSAAELENRLRREEFVAALGVTPERFRLVTLVLLLGLAGGLGAFTLSWGIALAAGISVWYFRQARMRASLERRRSRVLINEVIPTAQGISGALSAGMSLSQALSDISRGGTPSQLQASIRRAMTDSRGLEEGMRAERERTGSDILREFYEILADGASTSRQSAMTAETLDKFADLSMSRRSAYQAALRVTAQARSTRTILTFLVPGVFLMSVASGGSPDLLQKPIANIVVLAALGLIGTAYWITNLFIDDVVKGY